MGEKGQRYSIQVTDATKDGEILKFTVQTKLVKLTLFYLTFLVFSNDIVVIKIHLVS